MLAEFLHLYERDGIPPTIRDVQEYAGLSSTSVTANALERLVAKGWLKKARTSALTSISRNYLPTEEGRAVAE